jgi:hypothetical protein
MGNVLAEALYTINREQITLTGYFRIPQSRFSVPFRQIRRTVARELRGRTGNPTTICIVGEGPFGNVFDEFTRGQDVQGCRIASIRPEERNRLQLIVQIANRARRLTVRESELFQLSEGASILLGRRTQCTLRLMLTQHSAQNR